MVEDLYEVLKIDASADEATIREAIKQKNREFRRRTGNVKLEVRQDAERKLQLLHTAETILLDSSARADYDRRRKTQRHDGPEPTPGGGGRSTQTAEWTRRAERYLSAGDLAGAAHAAKEATTFGPNDARAWSLRAHVSHACGYLDEARIAYDRARDLDPGDVEIVMNHGRVLQDAGNFDGALACFRDARRLAPRDHRPHVLAGQLYLSGGRVDEGLKILEETNNDFSRQQMVRNTLAEAYLQAVAQLGVVVSTQGRVITTRDEAERASQYVTKAAALETSPAISQQVSAMESEVRRLTDRRLALRELVTWFGVGRVIMAALFLLYLALTLVGAMAEAAGDLVGAIVLVGLGYLVATQIVYLPGWRINRRMVKASAKLTSGL